jgi:hypothetical protein
MAVPPVLQPVAHGLGRRKQSDPRPSDGAHAARGGMSRRPSPGVDTATPRANVAVDVSRLLTHLEAAAASRTRLRVLAPP